MYSQYGEDDVVLRIFANSPPAALMEIGAWDPFEFSNSRALIEKGWRAVLVEPSPVPLKNLAMRYYHQADVQIVCAIVTPDPCGLVELAVTDDAVSTAIGHARASIWAKKGGYYGKILYPSVSVRQLFDQFGGGFEFVSIDTEGSSLAVMQAMFDLGPRPRVICVEHDGRIVEAAQMAEAANYRQVHLNGTNVIYEWTGARE